MSTEQPSPKRLSPYRGLEPFDERDAAFFFGRKRETQLITASLFAAPLTLLYGASGVGKSSVLRAGVLPQLRRRSELLPVVFPTVASGEAASASTVVRGWQTDPLGGIKEAVAQALYAFASNERVSQAFKDAVLEHEKAPLGEFLVACSRISRRRLMVILDQFEEYSLYHPENDAFADQFPGSIVSGDLSVSFLVSLREDALAKLDRFKGRIPTLLDSYRRIDHLDRRSGEDAMRLPLREYNQQQSPDDPPIEIEDALVETVLREVQTEVVQFEDTGAGTLDTKSGGQGRIETPYLQLVMMRLWERERAQGSTTLRWTTLQSEGGAAEIVRTHLDRVMEQFTPDEQDVAARVFHRLVTPSGAKIAFTVRDLAQYETVEAAQLAPILQRLEEGSRRILRRVAARADAAAEPRYEIFHDRLGQAILSWRAKRLAEQARAETQRQEAEQRRFAEDARAKLRERIDQAMNLLGSESQSAWVRMMFYLVTTDGRRLAQTATDLSNLSQQHLKVVEYVMKILIEAEVLRFAYGGKGSTDEARFEVVDDAVAGALLEWHSQYILRQSQAASPQSVRKEVAETEEPAPASRPAKEFPYRLVCDLLLKGQVTPFIGSGVSLSARPQDNPSALARRPFLPSNRELKELLARASRFPASEFEAADIAEVSAFYVQRFGRTQLDDLLNRTLGRIDYTPSETHRFLAETAKAAPLLILTTNYDTLMEQALDEVELQYDVIAYMPRQGDQSAKLAFLPFGSSQPQLVGSGDTYVNLDERTLLVRLHGPAIKKGNTIGSYVVTEEDQIDWLLRLHTNDAAIPPFVDYTLRHRHLLSLGHSSRDWSQRALLRSLFEKHTRYRKGWSVALNPMPLSIMTWQRYGVEVYNVHLNEWAERMREAGGLN